MRNILVVGSGVAGVLAAAVMAWRWRALPLVKERPDPASRRAAAVDALRVIAVALWAAVIAGLLVPGLGGRLMMRILAATSSPETQGLLTEANEIVGEITLGGTIGLLLFVGLLGGLTVAPFYPFVRRLLPRTAWRAGLVLAVPLLGIVGVSDPLSPENRDFVVLQPRVLAVALVIVLALLFGVTYTAVAARLDAAIPALSARPANIASHTVLVLLVGPPLAVGAALYVVARTVDRGRLAAWIEPPWARRLARGTIVLVVALTAGRTVIATAEILAR